MTQATDKLAVLEAAHRFDFTIDAGNFDAHTALFADGFTFESDFGNFDSVEGYREWVEGFHEQMQQAGGTRHITANPVVGLDGDRATLDAYLLIYAQGDGSLLGTATFKDDYVHDGQSWKLRKRVLKADANVNVGN